MGDRIVIMNAGVICQVGTPLEIYDKPASRFVAGFIGSPPMNFFEGEIVADGAEAGVLLGGGIRLPLSRPDLAAPAGRKVYLGIRPEHISLTQGGRMTSEVHLHRVFQTAKVPSVIEVVEPLGHRVILTASSAAGPFQMETEIHAGVKSGDKVDLWFDMNRAYLFDRESEAAI